jgi:hypothetical protein
MRGRNAAGGGGQDWLVVNWWWQTGSGGSKAMESSAEQQPSDKSYLRKLSCTADAVAPYSTAATVPNRPSTSS